MAVAPRTVDGVVSAAASRDPGATHLILPDGSTVSYAETLQRARRLAAVLTEAGILRGDRVAAVLRSSRELIEVYVACGLVGAVAVPANGLNTARENRLAFADCAPAALVAEAALLDRVPPEAIPPSVELRLVTQGDADGWRRYDDAIQAAREMPESAASRPDDPALIIYSSGTTGNPKGIVLSHAALVDNARMISGVLGYGRTDRFLTILPTYSSFGYSFDFLQAALAGASTVIMPVFAAATAVDLVERHRVTCLAGVPTMFVRMAEHMAGRDLTCLRLLDVGGGPVPDKLKADLRSSLGCETVESYGLTEIAPVASAQPPGMPGRPGSCGPPLPGVEARVVDEADREVPRGQPGELIFRCGTIMLGYWNQPELTATTLRNGWLHSGDIGKMDEAGHLYVLDRLKDMIVTSGNNVYPKEVENVIFDHPAVQSAAVVGVPDEVRGERVHAFVVLAPGAAATADDILAHCRRGLAIFKVPRGITFLDELPLTGSGKVRRFKLRELVRTTTSGTIA
ncbi:MAG: AMP-binding protein [Candidatus Rokubacteria bacterium]|nr:AMP-binding protein [Candidatus Rokubacteria bacterium]